MTTVLILFVGVWVACAMGSSAIAERKGLSGGLYFFVGLLLGVIGLIIAAAAPAAPGHERTGPGSPPGPGWYDDPWRRDQLRWFDGREWTEQSRSSDTAR